MHGRKIVLYVNARIYYFLHINSVICIYIYNVSEIGSQTLRAYFTHRKDEKKNRMSISPKKRFFSKL